MNNNIRRIGIVLFVVGMVLFIMAVTLISHTVRLSVYAKRFLVRSMQLVGATENFILKPFMRFFMIQGFLGALLALIVLTFMIIGLQRSIPELSMVSNFGAVAMIYAAVLLFGMLMTIMASYFPCASILMQMLIIYMLKYKMMKKRLILTRQIMRKNKCLLPVRIING